MLIELNRHALIKIISAMSPHYEIMDHPLIKGSIDGSYGRWSWDVNFEDLTDEQLVTILALLTGAVR
jgi:hypothetical protein